MDPACNITEDDTGIDEDGLELFWYEKLSRIVTDVNHHMAGFVVMNLIKKMKICYKCAEFIELSHGKGSSKLSERKDLGYLRKPTQDVCRITEMVEKIFRANKHLLHQKNLMNKLILKTYLATAANVFNSPEMMNHVVQQERSVTIIHHQ